MGRFLNYSVSKNSDKTDNTYPDAGEVTATEAPSYKTDIGEQTNDGAQTTNTQQTNVQIPEQTPGLDIAGLAKLLGPSPQERMQQEEQERQRTLNAEKWGTFFNGLRNLGNLYYTTKSAVPQKFNDPNLQIEQQYQNERARRIQAQQQEQKYRQDLYNMYSKDADRKFKEGTTLANIQNAINKNTEGVRHNQVNEGIAKGKAAEGVRHNQVTEGQNEEKITNQATYQKGVLNNQKTRNAITDNHNKATESIAARRLAYQESGGGGGNSNHNYTYTNRNGKKVDTIVLRDGKKYYINPEDKGAIISLQRKMEDKARKASDTYSKKNDFTKAQHYRTLADNIVSAGKSESGLYSIIKANIADFPSMDKDIRSIIGKNTVEEPAPKPAQKPAQKVPATKTATNTSGGWMEGSKKSGKNLNLGW